MGCGIVIIMMWSIATSTSRVLLGRNFVLDGIAGAILGVLEVIIVYNLLFVSEHFQKHPTGGLQVIPAPMKHIYLFLCVLSVRA